MKKSNNILTGTGILTAISASLCCITPVLALISGTSGIASTFSWLEPLRPYLIGITILVLGFAWYQKLKPTPKDDCGCEVPAKEPFMQSKLFLLIVTGFSIVMLSFPYYSSIFYSNSNQQIEVSANQNNLKQITFSVDGMTCSSCEQHITHSVNNLEGIFSVSASYENESAIVSFDSVMVSQKEIEEAINETGYTVKNK